MSWVCKNCSHSNLDEDNVCIVCDTPREEVEINVVETEDEELDRDEEHEDDSYEVSYSERKHTLNKLFTILIIICSFIAGQIAQYVVFKQSGYVLILSDFISSTANYSFNVLAFLIVTTIIGAFSVGLYIYLLSYFAEQDKPLINWLISVSFAAVMGANPAIGSFFVIFFAVLLLILKSKSGAKVFSIIFLSVSIVSMAIMLPIAKTIPPVYIITLDLRNGSDEFKQFHIKLDEEMPEIEGPTRIGYSFLGFYDQPSNGNQYYDAEMQSVRKWDVNKSITLYAYWAANTYTISFNKQGGTGGTNTVTATYDSKMPIATAPTKSGYKFDGYFDSISGGKQYYNSNMDSVSMWNKTMDTVLYAHWKASSYRVTLDMQGGNGGSTSVTVTYGQPMPSATKPSRAGYSFNGYYTRTNGSGTQYYNSSMSSVKTWDIANNTTLYAYWTANKISASASPSNLSDIDGTKTSTISVSGGSGSYSYYVTNNPSGVRCSFSGNVLSVTKTEDSQSGSITVRVTDTVTNATATCSISYSTTGGCVATGTLITLADGSQVPVENLTGNELLLVWNMRTGDFDSAPILFIDKDDYAEYNIVHLYFSDGAEVKVVNEHAFWDTTLNEYVFLRSDASNYIGHWFNKQKVNDGSIISTNVQLVDVRTEREFSCAWSPVTYGHMCYYVNGMLSMPGNTEGLINIFAVNENMSIDMDAMNSDISSYGLFTYEEFNAIMPVSKKLFEAFNGQYLKVSIGKGLIDWERIEYLIKCYDK